MKQYIYTFAVTALITGPSFATINGKKPAFMDKQQLAAMRAEASSSQLKETTDRAFFTGRPYLASSDEYAFKYRSYKAGIGRWTSEDPSGFPDGTNQSSYAPTPTSEFDYLGLWKVMMISSGNGSNSREFEWLDGRDGLHVGGILTSNTDPNTAVDSIAVSGLAAAQYSFPGVAGYENQTIQQSYTISVDSNGNLSLNGTGTAQVGPNKVGIGIQGSAVNNGSSLTLNYNILGAYGENGGLTGFGFQVVGSGANMNWNNGTNPIAGFISITFQAVE